MNRGISSECQDAVQQQNPVRGLRLHVQRRVIPQNEPCMNSDLFTNRVLHE